MYEITFSPAAARYIKKIREKGLKFAFKEAFDSIAENPYLGTERVGDLTGAYGLDVYYNKTNYEIAYRVYEGGDKLVVVILAGTRENFYDELTRSHQTDSRQTPLTRMCSAACRRA